MSPSPTLYLAVQASQSVKLAEYLYTGPWVHAGDLTTPSRSQSQIRSLTPTPKVAGLKQVTKSTSTPQLGKMAAVMAPPNPSSLFRTDSEVMNTIPDPRAASPASAPSRSGSTDSGHHPDLNNEVATLSTKLINAINYQTSLDDSLQATRHELEAARERLVQLETAAKEHAEMIGMGLLVKRDDYDNMESELRKELTEERRQKGAVEREKRRIESELENLTTALFEEANTMVAAARKEREASEKRNEQLKNQLNDTELLLASHQEQLQDLKAVMQQMSSDRDENENNTHISTAPSTPGVVPQDKLSRIFEAANLTPNTPGSDDIPPDQPLRFSHLIHPVLRSDLQSYKEFQEMLKVSRASAPTSRAASGNYGGINVMGLGALSSMSQANGSSTSLPSAHNSPNRQNGNGSPRDSTSSLPPLKENKFYKRALAEDIEPTLRLDIAPGLSWLARRTVLNSMTAGSLVVEPHPLIPKFHGPVFACSLCGENRKGELYTRKHRFRTSESDDAQRYPLCDYCLGRVRATCDYIGFLRMVKDGHWRAETEDERKSAWEESVRLRERMFWARLGGGVVPAFVPLRESPRSPTFATRGGVKVERKSEESSINGVIDSAVDMRDPKKLEPQEYDPFRSDGKEKRVSIGKTVISPRVATPEKLNSEEEKRVEKAAEEQLQNEVKKSMQSLSLDDPTAKLDSAETPLQKGKDKEQRLSITIPGAFE